nr:MAG TPA: hypothetical protein [Caudoviricetes sp.]
MHIKPRTIATVLCMIFFIGFAVCGVVRSTYTETSEIKQSYPVLAEAEPVIIRRNRTRKTPGYRHNP